MELIWHAHFAHRASLDGDTLDSANGLDKSDATQVKLFREARSDAKTRVESGEFGDDGEVTVTLICRSNGDEQSPMVETIIELAPVDQGTEPTA